MAASFRPASGVKREGLGGTSFCGVFVLASPWLTGRNTATGQRAGVLAGPHDVRFPMKGLRKLVRSDRSEVLRINAGSLPGVAPLDENEFDRLLKLPNLHLIREDADKTIVGYALAFPSDAPYDGEEFQAFHKSLPGPYIYIDQVAVAPNMRRRGVASSLYLALEIEARRRSMSALCCEVNLDPPNPASMAFHLGRGFQRLEVLITADGRTVALMSRSQQ